MQGWRSSCKAFLKSREHKWIHLNRPLIYQNLLNLLKYDNASFSSLWIALFDLDMSQNNVILSYVVCLNSFVIYSVKYSIVPFFFFFPVTSISIFNLVLYVLDLCVYNYILLIKWLLYCRIKSIWLKSSIHWNTLRWAKTLLRVWIYMLLMHNCYWTHFLILLVI